MTRLGRPAVATSFAVLLLLLGAAHGPASAEDITLYAASSTRPAMEEVIAAFESATQLHVAPSWGGSGAQARQIAAGAPAQIFVSSSPAWMDYLAVRKLLSAGSRKTLFSNRLVLISRVGYPIAVNVERGMDLAEALGDEKLAIGDPETVPVGAYAKAALETLGGWNRVAAHVEILPDERAVLEHVEHDDVALGIVYATDAYRSRALQVLGVFPASTYPPILYEVSLTGPTPSPDAAQLVAFMLSGKAYEIYAKYRFVVTRR